NTLKMKTIFDISIRNELIKRIHLLTEDNTPVWGKMNVYQMLKHNTYWNDWMLGKSPHTYKQELLGKVIGKIVLKKVIKDDKPVDKNIPTSSQFKAKEPKCDLEHEKSLWTSLVKDYENYNN